MGSRSSRRWSWTSALVGAVSATAAAGVLAAKPRDPAFQLISISLTSFTLHFPVLDADLILTVHVTNPNVVPIEYGPSTMSIFYDGSLLGTAALEAGAQPSRSCQVVRLPARLDGIQLAHHASRFFADVARREMVLDAAVEINGTAKLLRWAHRFRALVNSRVTVDPVFLDVIDQDNRSVIQLA
ncbi:hypothetical protein H6P81_003575 [Aristolochia fimbriata]|uniref:Water stress and hypersensitive response domain-containing protein n=1 Tax=Aristolochia fimbriata TaxID=158543 RepID=A0AAV7FCY9_ARIFI|nr:hypothetical protein H6P81_003575 [Aristolochia fimbriata]